MILVNTTKGTQIQVTPDDLENVINLLEGTKKKKEFIKSVKPKTKSTDYGYFMLCRQCNSVKIGFSKDVNERKSVLQIGHPHKLEILHTEGFKDGDGRKWELNRKEQFNQYLIQGEWYQYEGLKGYISNKIKNKQNFYEARDRRNARKGDVCTKPTKSLTSSLRSVKV